MTLATNEGSIDRAVRVILGITLVGVVIAGSLTTPLLYLVGVVAALLLVTGAIGFCPLYAALRISTAGNRVALGRR